MRLEEEVAQLREENQTLREALEQARDQLSQAQGQLEVALERIQELEKRKHAASQFRQGQCEEAETGREKAPQEARGQVQSCASAIGTHADRGASDCLMPRLSFAFGRHQPGSPPGSDRCASVASCRSDRTSHLQGVVREVARNGTKRQWKCAKKRWGKGASACGWPA